ncbi:MAG TPA: FAD-binding oxidoreductase [Rhodospirillaceae bacterium]|nr:FAD-binding oxidoreductase [Rhodospirillaceae bacterium]MAX63405.1 FAD-binding oxidoreductase [Rhodospirillaceae bacterium]MBB59274.1 FAD-binding oxidoreductase [Rhodospirillaceae bacterium]HAE01300.1 FAD-binding oxidoreductase [Rhodospirillaceae bacterium]HBM13284.1 FAD-binding oxidoreductase [Rhodospirillaceae bacterium]
MAAALERVGSGFSDNPALDILRQRFGERATSGQAICDQHGRGEGWYPSAPPDLVVFAETTEDVAEVVRICAEHKVPVVPFGTGTSLEGHVAALKGGVSLDLSGMNKLLEVNAEDLDCRVQAGVTRKQLNEDLRDTGLFFPIDPGANASLGGMASTRASGTNAVRYGTMRENVMGLTVVTADGRIIKTGGRARKSAAGYDLTRLFVGAEGTLGVITEVQLRLYGIPESIRSAVCQFPDLESAVNTVILTIQLGIPVARIELLDEVQMDACIRYSKLENFEPKVTLFFEFHGTEASTQEQAQQVQELSAEHGGSAFQYAATQEERTTLWEARHNAFYAACAAVPGKKGMATDACVPISKLADCILDTKRDIQDSGLYAPIVGHVGDGNYHLCLMFDPDDQEELGRAKALVERMNHRAISYGGTCTGEHGIGYGKMHFLTAEHGDAVAVMRQVKKALDPDNIMNPGKILSL